MLELHFNIPEVITDFERGCLGMPEGRRQVGVPGPKVQGLLARQGPAVGGLSRVLLPEPRLGRDGQICPSDGKTEASGGRCQPRPQASKRQELDSAGGGPSLSPQAPAATWVPRKLWTLGPAPGTRSKDRP